MPLSIESIDEEIADLRRQMNQIAETIHAAESLKSALRQIQNRRNGVQRSSRKIRTLAPSTAAAGIGNASDAIRGAIAKCGPTYSIDDIAAKLEEAGIDTIARTTISQTLSEWGRKGKIAIKRRGSGTIPSIYRTLKTSAQVRPVKRVDGIRSGK